MSGIADIGPGLVRARKDSGISQRELARRMGVQQPQIARWERNAYSTATLERVEAVARALGFEAAPPAANGLAVSASGALLAAETATRYGSKQRKAASSTDDLLARIGTDRRQLTRYCRKHGIEELAVFGSALRVDFGPHSDVDFLVRFSDAQTPDFETRLAMQEELERLLGRPVDLAERTSVQRGENHLRRRRILGSARVVYVA